MCVCCGVTNIDYIHSKKRALLNKKEGKINEGWSAIGRMQFSP